MDEILPNLFLGNYQSARNLDFLVQKKITHILVVGNELDKHYPGVSFNTKKLNLITLISC